MAKYHLTSKLRSTYHKEYPLDDYYLEMSKTATFVDLFEALDFGKDVYEVIFGNSVMGDSIVRERLFEILSNIMGCDYEYIYEKWLAA